MSLEAAQLYADIKFNWSHKTQFGPHIKYVITQ